MNSDSYYVAAVFSLIDDVNVLGRESFGFLRAGCLQRFGSFSLCLSVFLKGLVLLGCPIVF